MSILDLKGGIYVSESTYWSKYNKIYVQKRFSPEIRKRSLPNLIVWCTSIFSGGESFCGRKDGDTEKSG